MIYTLGESLLDIIVSSLDNVEAHPGGAMLNTAISLGRSDIEVSIITELGDDETSKLITNFLNDNNVNSNFIKFYEDNSSPLAIAFLDEFKKPSYTFVKNYPDKRSLSGVPEFTNNDILLFGSMYAIDKDIRSEILEIITSAKENNTLIIYDPNIRNSRHLTNAKQRDALIENLAIADIIKGSDEDFNNIFGNQTPLLHINKMRDINAEALIIITKGENGLVADANGHIVDLKAIKTNVVSTIGAGDAINSGIIFAINSKNINKSNLLKLDEDELKQILFSGLTFAANVCSTGANYIPK